MLGIACLILAGLLAISEIIPFFSNDTRGILHGISLIIRSNCVWGNRNNQNNNDS